MGDGAHDLVRCRDAAALAEAAARQFTELARAATAQRGKFSVALSGGSTPAALYHRLRDRAESAAIDWPAVHVFWGDERCVPPEHDDSNYRMATTEILAHVPIPAGNIHRIRGEIDPAEAAREYEAELRGFFMTLGSQPPRLDLVLLGLGEDGHTASLFPGSSAVKNAVAGTESRWVVENYVPRLGAWRVTLMPAAINAAAQVTFLVAGSHKAPSLLTAFSPASDPGTFPTHLITPANGRLTWFVDAAATSELDTR